MGLSMHDASVPVFQQMLGSLDDVLAKAEADVEARKLDPEALLGARLSPDMFPLRRQVQVACDFAKGVSARLAGVEAPVHDDSERSFAELRALVTRTRDFVGSIDAALFEGSDARDITLRPGTPRERTLQGKAYLLGYGLPQFFFHVTTTYALLRHNGVAIGKKDFMGTY